jgi:hypothetical protein
VPIPNRRLFVLWMTLLFSAGLVATRASAEVYNGYLLYSVNNAKTTYLRDLNGTVVHSWTHATNAGFSSLLSPQGNLIRVGVSTATGMTGAGATGVLEAVGKTGNILWSFNYKNANLNMHHYIDLMPNGHVLAIAWELKSRDSALARDINASGNVWPDHIIEVAPPDSADSTARIVWEWHMWDHLVPAAQAAAYPRRFSTALRATGSTSGAAFTGDWPHFNGMSYDPVRDEIAFSSRAFNEFYVIDHGTTTAEAADSVGGKRGFGGDLLYRWGAAANYGLSGSQYFNVIHAVKHIPPGYPGAGNFIVINNRQGQTQTHCVEVVPPRDTSGVYTKAPDLAWGPAAALDTFTTSGYYHTTTGSAQRLPNGNTLCVESDNGMIREWDSTGVVVWSYNAGATPSAFKYAPDDSGIVALLGVTALSNPLMARGTRPEMLRRGGELIIQGNNGARIEVFNLVGKRLIQATLGASALHVPDAHPHEPVFVRIRTGKKVDRFTVPPVF